MPRPTAPLSPQGRQGTEPEQKDKLKSKFSSSLNLICSNPVSQMGDRQGRRRGRKLQQTPGGQAGREQGGAERTKRKGGWGPGEAPDAGPRESDIQRPRPRWVGEAWNPKGGEKRGDSIGEEKGEQVGGNSKEKGGTRQGRGRSGGGPAPADSGLSVSA